MQRAEVESLLHSEAAPLGSAVKPKHVIAALDLFDEIFGKLDVTAIGPSDMEDLVYDVGPLGRAPRVSPLQASSELRNALARDPLGLSPLSPRLSAVKRGCRHVIARLSDAELGPLRGPFEDFAKSMAD